MESDKLISVIPSVLILIFGIIGNLTSILIFSRRKLRMMSTFRFLLYLSITDLFLLIFSAPEVMLKSDFSLELRDFSLFPCNIQKFIAYSTSYMSSLLSIAVSVDRAQIVSRLAQFKIEKKDTDQTPANTATTNTDATKRNQKKVFWFHSKNFVVDAVVVSIVISSLLLNAHLIFLLKPLTLAFVKHSFQQDATLNAFEEYASNFSASKYEIFVCIPEKDSLYENFVTHAWLWADLSIFSVIPFVCMSTCTILIIIKLKKIQSDYRQRLTRAHTSRFTKRIFHKKLKKNANISIMLVLTNLYFLFIMIIFWIWFWFSFKGIETLKKSLIQSYVYMLLYSNNSFGIIFYLIWSEHFRAEFKKLFHWSTCS